MNNADVNVVEAVERDDDYYFEDGDCILQAQTRLFRLHKFLLKRNSSFFKNMFDWVSDDAVGGTSDDHPIICHDTPESFRALCWLLYASPKEIYAAQKPETASIRKLALVASMAHKYEFPTFQGWVLDVLQDMPRGFFSLATMDQLESTLFIARQCQYNALVEKLQGIITERIQDAEDPLLILPLVIQIAERSGDSHFQANSYYAYLKGTSFKGRGRRPARVSLANIRSGDCIPDLKTSNLSDIQQSRLNSGFRSLKALRDQLIDYPDLGECQAPRCVDEWRDWWTVQIGSVRTLMTFDDPDRLMETFLKKMKATPYKGTGDQSAHSSAATYARCKQLRVEALTELIDNFGEGLPGRFDCN